MARVAEVRWAAVIVVLWLLVTVSAFLVPPSLWHETHEIHVADVRAGQIPVVFERRTIRRDFWGIYSTETRNETTGEIGCAGTAVVRYRGGRSGWWSSSLVRWSAGDPDCANLAPGRWRVTVSRHFTPWLLFMKSSRGESNVFRVME